MITYEEALAIAKSKKSRINKCVEYNLAYVFLYDEPVEEGQVFNKYGENPIAIMKESGEALNFIAFAVMPDKEEIRTFDIEV